ncbi:WecB/TagA/CpsF family glycosyltransferase [Palleronia sp. LCG004]|uniref:WecB/TagA/CpsF family glycosyltransferase n=1 Tax=Palleronia sp. LCG004 TaxID=3079304 RepID=UPI002943BAAA|nr:WecB/TagA/CpsF family glycosyltransferase [Palleronia sp. LCG004]WOI58410.1 WecB/TagA/CpsF family glycosyltransferase [Palleronia sp. LCG004]
MSDTAHSTEAPTFPERRKVKILNAYVHDVTMDEVVETLDEGLLLTLHVDMIMKLQKDREFHDILDQFDVITCDSQILYFATKFLGTPVPERVSGSDYFPRFYQRHRDNPDVTVFLLGGKPGIPEVAAKNINAKVGREFVVGTYAPPFNFDDDPAEIERMIEAVNASGATVLLVGLGGGRQEKFIIRHRDRFENVKLYLPLGGTIDYEAGTFRRPPGWVTEWGFEWLYRLVKEPRQRWHRYVVHEPPVVPLLVKQKLGLYRNPFAGDR